MDNDVSTPESAGQDAASTAEVVEEKQAAVSSVQTDQGDGDVFDRAYVEKLRREAAGYRTKLKELEPLAMKYRDQQEAQKTELEKAQDLIAQLEAEKKAADVAALRAKVAQAEGVPVDLLPADGSEEELTEVAASLKKWASSQQPASKLPKVESAGRQSGGDDRDGMARQILGI